MKLFIAPLPELINIKMVEKGNIILLEVFGPVA